MKGMLLIGLLLSILAIAWFFPLGMLYGLVGGAAGYFISEGVMVKYFRKEFKLLSLKNSYAQQVSGNSVLN